VIPTVLAIPRMIIGNTKGIVHREASVTQIGKQCSALYTIGVLALKSIMDQDRTSMTLLLDSCDWLALA
jgi:hypothetical protein